MTKEELQEIIKKNKKKNRIYKIKRFFTWPYRAVKSTILCLRFPFLYPRNRWTGRHWNSWKINDYHKEHWNKAYQWETDDSAPGIAIGNWKTINRWEAFKISFLDGLERFLSIFHCVPTYTELDAMPCGWRKVFGIQMCKEIKRALLAEGGRKMLHNYRIDQIKEKFGQLRWYDSHGCEEVNRIIYKYSYISEFTCIVCGKSADYFTNGWLSPYCKEHVPEREKEKASEYFSDIPFYGVTNGKYWEKHKNDNKKDVEE